jgi:hypothetical protein
MGKVLAVFILSRNRSKPAHHRQRCNAAQTQLPLSGASLIVLAAASQPARQVRALRNIRLPACFMGALILRGIPRYATVPKRTNETLPVTIVSKLLMRVIKAHARWRWRA